MKGIYRTRVGYTGGSLENPTYHNLGEHTEAFQIDYDPGQISYEDILEIFWDSHNPTGRALLRQYMPAVFTHNQEQLDAALKSKAVLEEKLNSEINTPVVMLDVFYLAEDYHQKYYLQNNRELLAEMEAYYPELDDFINSTAVARLNGIVGGYANDLLIKEELDSYGLSEQGLSVLQRYR